MSRLSVSDAQPQCSYYDNLWKNRLKRLLELADDPEWPNLPQGEPHGIGMWLKKQRTKHKQRKLARWKIAALNAVPGFVWSVHDEQWDVQVKHLDTFKHDPAWPNLKFNHPSGLGIWLNTQCQARKEGTLSLGRQLALSSLPGFRWVTTGRDTKKS